MVATVQSDNYYFFSRRIGYSIGGFNAISKISRLGELYANNKKFDLSIWNEFIAETGVSTKVDRTKPSDKDTSSADHMANYYFYFDVFRKDERIITPLSTLEILGSLSSTLESSQYRKIAKLFLFSKIIENDGDYFANLLLTNFNSEEFLDKIEKNFLIKQSILIKHFRNINVQKNIKDALSMKVQGNFKDQDLIKKKQMENVESKVVPPRKSWVDKDEEFFLFNSKEKKLNERGIIYLQFLKNQRFYNEQEDVFCIWPKNIELQQRRLLVKELVDLSFDEATFYKNLVNVEYQNSKKLNNDEIFEILQNLFNSYRSLYESRALLRNQINSSTLKFIFYSFLAISGYEQISLDDFIDVEIKSQKPRLNKITIRGNHYGVKFN